MSGEEIEDREPVENPPVTPSIATKSLQPYNKLQRELSEEELKSPIVQRVLLYEKEKLEIEIVQLKVFRERHHALDIENAVLKESVKKSLASEIIFAVCLCVGAAALGYAPAVWSQQPSGYIFLVLGSVLIVGGVLARVTQR